MTGYGVTGNQCSRRGSQSKMELHGVEEVVVQAFQSNNNELRRRGGGMSSACGSLAMAGRRGRGKLNHPCR